MKNWLSIGQFAKLAELTPRTLRVYETAGLIVSHTRGENGYRYYQHEQLKLISRIKRFKFLGFSLTEIRLLLEEDQDMDSVRLYEFLSKRLMVLERQERVFLEQKLQLKNILTSLKKNKAGLRPKERSFIMRQIEKLLIVVTGVSDLAQTAKHIKAHFQESGQTLEVVQWGSENRKEPKRPGILILPEGELTRKETRALRPDIVVIRNIGSSSQLVLANYLNLFQGARPQMTTIFNADDRPSVELAANPEIKKGRIFYYSKNSGLTDQIKRIGGVVSDGEDVKIYGFNLQEEVSLKLKNALGFEEEVALLASVAAILDVGLDHRHLQIRK